MNVREMKKLAYNLTTNELKMFYLVIESELGENGEGVPSDAERMRLVKLIDKVN